MNPLLNKLIKKIPILGDAALRIARICYEDRLVFLQYPIKPQSRLLPGNNAFEKLNSIIKENMPAYLNALNSFMEYKGALKSISCIKENDRTPFWENSMFSPLDAMALYSFLRKGNPKCYVEIGSGNSTKFARKAIADGKLNTRLISIDPNPRAEIDALCDEVIREPFESTDLSVFSSLDAGDIVFFDGSHHCFMNSDVTVFFLEVLPLLKPGVLVQIHDIRLPYDYRLNWIEKHFSEQYLLAMGLMTKKRSFEIILPNCFLCNEEKSRAVVHTLWQDMPFVKMEEYGCSFWIKTL